MSQHLNVIISSIPKLSDVSACPQAAAAIQSANEALAGLLGSGDVSAVGLAARARNAYIEGNVFQKIRRYLKDSTDAPDAATARHLLGILDTQLTPLAPSLERIFEHALGSEALAYVDPSQLDLLRLDPFFVRLALDAYANLEGNERHASASYLVNLHQDYDVKQAMHELLHDATSREAI